MCHGFALPGWAIAACLATLSALTLAGCAAGPARTPVGTADASGYMATGTRSTITVTNTSYERALDCVGATARLLKTEGAATDPDEIRALGAAWSSNAVELGARRGLSQAAVVSAAGAAGGGMTVEAASAIWTGCRTGR